MNWRNYPKPKTVAQRQSKAAKAAKILRKQGKNIAPVFIEGRTIATTFWGKAWCTNLESYQDYASRLPRGRSYVRSGCVLDLKITPGAIEALVQGSSRYRINIAIKPMPRKRWDAFKQGTQGRISSAIALLNGELPPSVLEQIIAPNTGLFPKPAEISLSCNCPDWAVMCKHVAAALYGVGHRLDEQPELLFTLRKVNADELISHLTSAQSLTGGALDVGVAEAAEKSPTLVANDLLGELFGIELGNTESISTTKARVRKKAGGKKKSVRKKVSAKKITRKKMNGKTVTGKIVARKKAIGKKATSKKIARKKAIGKKTIGKKIVGKKATGKKTIGKKDARKKIIGKKAISKKLVRKKPGSKSAKVR